MLKLFLSIFGSSILLGAAEPKLSPRHDPADQLFRRAPMAQSARTIVLNLDTNIHAAFDTELGRAHTIWRGGPLNLWGPPYSHAKSPFICDFAGERLFSFPHVATWSSKEKALPMNFGGIRTQGNLFQLHYAAGGVKIVETLKGKATADEWSVQREFELPGGARVELTYLAFAESGAEIEAAGNTLKVRGTNGTAFLSLEPADFKWVVETRPQHYKTEVITDAGTEKGNPVVVHDGPETRAYVRVPQSSMPFSFSVSMSSGARAEEIATRPAQSAKVFSAGSEKRRNSGDENYAIEHFPLPAEQELIITGMDWLNERDLAVCTWLGEIYIIENASGATGAARYRRYARGLNEPLGLTVVKNEIYLVQKGELTRVSDVDGNGAADWFECINDDWGYSGNYHSYSFGPLVTAPNEFMVFITGQRGRPDLAYQGAAVRIDGNRAASPFAYGLRVPHGWSMYEGDIFVTDNQGNWIGACKLNHVKEGKFYGFQLPVPADKRWPAESVQPPVLWFPRSLSPSTSGIAVINTDAFGPFQGQMLIGDFQNSIVMRAFLEKVRGEWQGAAFPFAKGFLSGVNRLGMGADGKLYVGGGKRTWSTAAPREYSLERVSYTGKMPFEVKEVHATSDGFELRFTKALEADPARDPENYLVKQSRFKYHPEYGSPEFDHEGNPGATEVPVKSATLSDDKTVVRLVIPELKAGYMTSFQLAVNSAEDEDLRNDAFYYTLNNQPE